MQMYMAQIDDTQARKRTSNACIACRQSKIKCSGDDPCLNCQRRLLSCQYGRGSENDSGVENPTSAPQQQNSGAGQIEQRLGSGTKRCRNVEVETSHGRSGKRRVNRAHSIWTSPFTLPSKTIINTHNNRRSWIWLAPSSPWSFTVRLSLMVTEKLHLGGSPYVLPSFGKNEAYSLEWDYGLMSQEMPDVSGLPSHEDALYLFDTVKLHLGQIYRLLDKRVFISTLQEFYAGGATAEKAKENQLWFIQFLLLMAIGRAILSRSKHMCVPAGAKFFQRAMSLVPDQGSLWKDSLMAIDMLALVGLYLYAIDHRESGHIYVRPVYDKPRDHKLTRGLR